MRTQSRQRSTTKGISSSNNLASKSMMEGSSSLPKLTIVLQDKEYTIPISTNSTIEKLALELMLMIYDELLEQQLNEESREVHAKICELLLSSVKQVIMEETNFKNKSFLSQIVEKYQSSNFCHTKQELLPNKYFINNYIQSSDHESQDNQSFTESNSASRATFKLYDKAQKSIEKMRKLQKENIQQKSKIQISYCTFHPNISKSQKKIKSKESSNVFNRLYTNADELKLKNFFKKKEIEDQEEKVNSSFKFVPQINHCSKQIMKLKQQQDNSEFEDLNKSQVSFQASSNQSYKYLKDKSSKKVFQKLYDSSFYENRMNKTLQKIIQDKQNQCPFHPQISAGTKRMTKNLPNLESRLKLYALKKMQKENSESGYFSKSKDVKRNLSRSEIQPSRKQIVGSNKGKGIKKMLAMVKNSGDQNEVNCSKSKQKGFNRLNSEIYRVNTQFFDDSYEFDGTPKKFNLQPLSENISVQNQRVNRESYQKVVPSMQKAKFSEINHLQSRQMQNKEKIFEKIFVYLSMGSNELTVKKISSNRNIPVEILQILMPLLKQLAEMDTELDEEEFVWSLENLYQQLNIQMKAILLSWGLKLFKQTHQNTRSINNLKHVKTDGSVFQLAQ